MVWPQVEGEAVRKLPLGDEGKAEVVECGEILEVAGVTGERECVEDVVFGGEMRDFRGMEIGLAKAGYGGDTDDDVDKEEEDGEGESERSLLLSLLLSSHMLMRLRIVVVSSARRKGVDQR